MTMLPAAAAAQRIPEPSSKVRIVLDTDTYNEIDDQYAVAYALLSPRNMTVEAIHAAPFHNNRSSGAGDGMQKSYEEIGRVLKALGREGATQVKKGSRQFFSGAGKPVDSPAARDLIERAMASDEPLYSVPVGAPTNIASAILMEPRMKDKITVVWLGGQPYEFPSAHEFNLRQDPHASRVLYDSGVKLVNITTRNVSEQLRTTVPELEKFLKGKSKIADYLFDIFVEYAREHNRDPSHPYSKVIWDISAIAWLIDPNWITTKLTPSPILAENLEWKHDTTRHKVRVATHVNRDAIFADLFKKLVNA
ncbi:MAG: nucleoside hydrolase [bacterium]|nr:nucleoside hydrolase [bacterium]